MRRKGNDDFLGKSVSILQLFLLRGRDLASGQSARMIESRIGSPFVRPLVRPQSDYRSRPERAQSRVRLGVHHSWPGRHKTQGRSRLFPETSVFHLLLVPETRKLAKIISEKDEKKNEK